MAKCLLCDRSPDEAALLIYEGFSNPILFDTAQHWEATAALNTHVAKSTYGCRKHSRALAVLVTALRWRSAFNNGAESPAPIVLGGKHGCGCCIADDLNVWGNHPDGTCCGACPVHTLCWGAGRHASTALFVINNAETMRQIVMEEMNRLGVLLSPTLLQLEGPEHD